MGLFVIASAAGFEVELREVGTLDIVMRQVWFLNISSWTRLKRMLKPVYFWFSKMRQRISEGLRNSEKSYQSSSAWQS